MSDTKTPAIMEVITLAVHVAVIYIFIGAMDHGSIALAFTLSKTIKVLVLSGLLKRKIENIQLPHNLRFFGKIIIAVGIMLTMMSGYHGWYASQFDLSSLFQQALLIGSSGSLGVLTFFIVTIVLKVQEVRLILRAVSNYVRHQ
jgi:peptidoglycan biosynthesis protein MviN/MurJ (putative lipid II flippase)